MPVPAPVTSATLLFEIMCLCPVGMVSQALCMTGFQAHSPRHPGHTTPFLAGVGNHRHHGHFSGATLRTCVPNIPQARWKLEPFHRQWTNTPPCYPVIPPKPRPRISHPPLAVRSMSTASPCRRIPCTTCHPACCCAPPPPLHGTARHGTARLGNFYRVSRFFY